MSRQDCSQQDCQRETPRLKQGAGQASEQGQDGREPEVLILAATPHAGGTTARAAGLVARGAQLAGACATILPFWNRQLLDCIHCDACQKPPFACALAGKDDVEAVFRAMDRAGLVVWISPVYFYGLPARAKALVDRSQRFYARLALQDTALPAGQPNPLPPAARQASALFLAGRPRGARLFAGSVLTVRYFFRALGLELADCRGLRGLEKACDITDELADELVAWGRDLVLAGRECQGLRPQCMQLPGPYAFLEQQP